MDPANSQSKLPSPPPSMPPVDQPITHSAPPEAKEKKKSKAVPLLIVIMVILILAIVGYLLWITYQSNQSKVTQQVQTEQPILTPAPTTDPIAGWETYSNKVYGYNIKYPSTWYLRVTEDLPSTVGFWIENTEGEASGVWVFVKENTNNLSPEKWWEDDIKNSHNYDSQINNTTRGNIKINEHNAYFVKTTGEWTSRPFYNTYINMNGYIYNVSTDILTEGRLATYNQILSTFEFTDAPEKDETDNDNCVISGCNGELCATEALTSTCVYKNEYACYTTAKCEVQGNGKCGWTETEELTSCISETK